MKDAAAIYAVLEEAALEIPVRTDGERADLLLGRIQRCCQGGYSLVAVDRSGSLIGFLLAELDSFHEALQLPYGAVRFAARKHGAFGALIGKTMKAGLPLFATVKHDNKSKMADRLRRLGFVIHSEGDDQIELLWTPPEAP